MKTRSHSLRAMEKVVAAVIVMVMASGVLFTSCGDNEDEPESENIWDFAGVDIPIRIVDEQGNNLLDPDVEGNWLDEEFSVGYNDKSYEADWEYFHPFGYENVAPESRTYVPDFFGLAAVRENQYRFTDWEITPKGCMLLFGSFMGEHDHDVSVDFMIHSINTVFHIEMTHRFWWEKKNIDPRMETTYKLNGKPVDGSVVTIVLPRKSH